MDYFELLGAMQAQAKVVTKIVQPSYTTVLVGTVVGVCHRRGKDGKIKDQVEIVGANKNSITIVPFDAVEPLFEA